MIATVADFIWLVLAIAIAFPAAGAILGLIGQSWLIEKFKFWNNRDLEKIKAELTEELERIKAELVNENNLRLARESATLREEVDKEITRLKAAEDRANQSLSSALSANTQAQQLLAAKRIEAHERLWDAYLSHRDLCRISLMTLDSLEKGAQLTDLRSIPSKFLQLDPEHYLEQKRTLPLLEALKVHVEPQLWQIVNASAVLRDGAVLATLECLEGKSALLWHARQEYTDLVVNTLSLSNPKDFLDLEKSHLLWFEVRVEDKILSGIKDGVSGKLAGQEIIKNAIHFAEDVKAVNSANNAVRVAVMGGGPS